MIRGCYEETVLMEFGHIRCLKIHLPRMRCRAAPYRSARTATQLTASGVNEPLSYDNDAICILQMTMITLADYDNVFLKIISDVDECDQSGFCLHGQCHNTDGSFRCVCDAGYTLSSDGTYCSGMAYAHIPVPKV